MKKILNRIYCLEEKIGKQNFILLGLIIVFIIITGLYQTFSLFTSSEGVSLLDGIKTFKFILGADNVENSVVIAAGGSKNVAVTVSNRDKIKLQYGVYYTSSDDLTDVELGYKHDTEYLPNGLIDSGKDYVVMIQIDNRSSSNITISLGIIYGLESGGDLVLGENQYWLEKKWNFPLNEVESGSYVRYIGNNGCTGMSCSGQNANYVSDSDMGYCAEDSYKYIVSGWRIAYMDSGNTYLTSAGSPECLCTDNAGATSNSSCKSEDNTKDVVYHLNNLNNEAINYCNGSFTSENVCTASTVWNMNKEDFNEITASYIEDCLNSPEISNCGYQNSLIDNGSFYWIANSFLYDVDSLYYTYLWYPYASPVGNQFVGGSSTGTPAGIRPIIKLDSSVVVISGTGTYQDPYRIDNLDTIKDLSGNMNNGVLGGTVWDREAGTLTTNGISDYVDCGLAQYDFKDSLSYVIRMKVNLVNASGKQIIIGNFEDGGSGFYMESNFLFRLRINNSYQTLNSNVAVNTNQWYTLVGVYDGSKMSIYLDGELMNSMNVTGNIDASPMPLNLGANPEVDGHMEYSNVTFSSVLVFDRALSESEIISDYSENITGPTNQENLLIYYDFKR